MFNSRRVTFAGLVLGGVLVACGIFAFSKGDSTQPLTGEPTYVPSTSKVVPLTTEEVSDVRQTVEDDPFVGEMTAERPGKVKHIARWTDDEQGSLGAGSMYEFSEPQDFPMRDWPVMENMDEMIESGDPDVEPVVSTRRMSAKHVSRLLIYTDAEFGRVLSIEPIGLGISKVYEKQTEEG